MGLKLHTFCPRTDMSLTSYAVIGYDKYGQEYSRPKLPLNIIDPHGPHQQFLADRTARSMNG